MSEPCLGIVFSSPEPLGSQGELIVYPSSRRPSVRRRRRRRRRRKQFQTSSSPKPLGRSKPNFMWRLLGYGGTILCSRHLGHMTKMAATPIYGKTLQKSSSPELVGRF